MGRAAERQGLVTEAIDAYEAYLAAGAEPQHVDQVRAALKALRERRPPPTEPDRPETADEPDEADGSDAWGEEPESPAEPADEVEASAPASPRRRAVIRATLATAVGLGALVGAYLAASAFDDAAADMEEATGQDRVAFDDAAGRARTAEVAGYALAACGLAALGYGGYVWFTLPPGGAAAGLSVGW